MSSAQQIARVPAQTQEDELERPEPAQRVALNWGSLWGGTTFWWALTAFVAETPYIATRARAEEHTMAAELDTPAPAPTNYSAETSIADFPCD